MTFFTLLWKARAIEKYRLNYEKEKINSIVNENPEVEQTYLQRWRHYRLYTQKRISRTFKKWYPEGSGVSNFVIYLMTDQTFPNFLLKSLMGFVGGIVLTYLCFMFFVFQLSISLIHATVMSSIIGILLTLGLAFSYRIRCLVFLLLPQFFSRVGRYTLTCYALVLILTGPATNTLKNSEVLSESMACTQEEIKTSVRRVNELMQKPYHYLKEPLKLMINRLKVISMRFKLMAIRFNRLVLSVVDFIQSSFSWLQSITNVCNEKLDSLYNRCSRLFQDGVDDYKTINSDNLIPFNMSHIEQVVCGDLKTLGLCYSTDFMNLMDEAIIASVRRKLRNFTAQIRNLFGVDLHILHSYSFNNKGSRTSSQVTAGIVTEIRHRADPLLTWLSWSSYITSLFLLLIIFRAKYYQHMYETRSRFDNRYITQEFQELDLIRQRQGRETVLPLNRRERAKYVTTTSFRLVASEKVYLTRSAVFMAITTFKLLIHMVADYSLYWVLITIRHHGRHQSDLIPGVPDTGAHVTGNGFVARLFRSIVETLNIPLSKHAPSPMSCLPDPYPPDFRRYVQIVVLIFLLWFFALFEPYGLRLRHLIMGLYRPERAKARATWLYNHIIRTRAGFMKYARRKLHREYKYYTESSQTFSHWLDTHIPFQCIKYLLSIEPKKPHCLLCGTYSIPSDPDTHLTKCRTPECPGTYCINCFSDIGNLCTICLSPSDYGDLSDVSLEKGSSDDSDNGSEFDGTTNNYQNILMPQARNRISKSRNRWNFFRRSSDVESENSISLLEYANLEQRNFAEPLNEEQLKNMDKSAESYEMQNIFLGTINNLENLLRIETIYICKIKISIINTAMYYNRLVRPDSITSISLYKSQTVKSSPQGEFIKPKSKDKRITYFNCKVKRSRKGSLRFCVNLNRSLSRLKTYELNSKRIFRHKRRRYSYIKIKTYAGRFFKTNKEQFNSTNKNEKEDTSNIKDKNYSKSAKWLDESISVENDLKNKCVELKTKEGNTKISQVDYWKFLNISRNYYTNKQNDGNTFSFIKKNFRKRKEKRKDDLLSLAEIYPEENKIKNKKDRKLNRHYEISVFLSDIDWANKHFKRSDKVSKEISDSYHVTKPSSQEFLKRSAENNKIITVQIANTLFKCRKGTRAENCHSVDETRPRTESTKKPKSFYRSRHTNIFRSVRNEEVHRGSGVPPQERILRRSSTSPSMLSSIRLSSKIVPKVAASTTKIPLRSCLTRIYWCIFRSGCTEENFSNRNEKEGILKKILQKDLTLFQRNQMCNKTKDCGGKNQVREFDDVQGRKFNYTKRKTEIREHKEKELKYSKEIQKNMEKDRKVEHEIETTHVRHMKSEHERKLDVITDQKMQMRALSGSKADLPGHSCLVRESSALTNSSPVCQPSSTRKSSAVRKPNPKRKCSPVRKPKQNALQEPNPFREINRKQKSSPTRTPNSVQKPLPEPKVQASLRAKKSIFTSPSCSPSTHIDLLKNYCTKAIKNLGNKFRKTSEQQKVLSIASDDAILHMSTMRRSFDELSPDKNFSGTTSSISLTSKSSTKSDITMSTVDYSLKFKRTLQKARMFTKMDQATSTPKTMLCDTGTLTCDWWSPILEKKSDTILLKKEKRSKMFSKKGKGSHDVEGKRFLRIITMKAIVKDGRIKFKSRGQIESTDITN